MVQSTIDNSRCNIYFFSSSIRAAQPLEKHNSLKVKTAGIQATDSSTNHNNTTVEQLLARTLLNDYDLILH